MIVVGVTGGIACYKAVELVRLLVAGGFAVQVIMSRGARNFVAPLTFQTLSGRPVATETFSLTQESEIGHIRLADSADLLIIAPATANVIGKLAWGIADDLLTTVAMATRAPILIAPAMNVHMYANPVLQENLNRLRQLGYHVMEPAEGYLACGYEGKGRLPDPELIVEQARRLLKPKDLEGEKLVVTAGPTHEPLDPVRFIANRSSGKMGYALARAAARRGAQVRLISGPTALVPPPGVEVVSVTTAAEMRQAVLEAFSSCTGLIMAAAVADFRPAEVAPAKIKRGTASLSLRLEPNPDILRDLGRKRDGRVLVGFAAETENVVANAEKKLREKGLDMVVANDVSRSDSGFNVDYNTATILDRLGGVEELPRMTKEELADRILDRLVVLKRSR
ncbi:MAG TPA: bifunctional phosphopantothenoylcysteine decarboxylase/phosphopantothenate--cysteine ligase CoaBC [candidate division Zixibacteria bacterium]|nr:bifunctional phosphopantothenoylcysteine decarboxylase/phosphopantothenate--cysteine ligase CoaBC [candidate division Zixibacteria bacterium]